MRYFIWSVTYLCCMIYFEQLSGIIVLSYMQCHNHFCVRIVNNEISGAKNAHSIEQYVTSVYMPVVFITQSDKLYVFFFF